MAEMVEQYRLETWNFESSYSEVDLSTNWSNISIKVTVSLMVVIISSNSMRLKQNWGRRDMQKLAKKRIRED